MYINYSVKVYIASGMHRVRRSRAGEQPHFGRVLASIMVGGSARFTVKVMYYL